MFVFIVITRPCSRLWINRVRLPILVVVSLSAEENKQADAAQDELISGDQIFRRERDRDFFLFFLFS